ncbi:2-C-methyl-D-erythritol 4-phosphate cytidylyltransferase [Phytoactinopolyspora halotolerans]|uniref:2-C-methyl-D-erythritol 4-phosphate cytidylyltransferase n=1 Tax=Phytoactinopolyspora halotolerans TaxID=1981512 RepID=UPI001C202E1B|nr:2-C-methyl-D-erythritol 4-phosphate cytidylyltransferase [Phytoactinopolyspora halotolerans]
MVGLIIPAAGAGERLGAGIPKALCALGAEALLVHAVRAGAGSGVVTTVVIAAPPGEADAVHKLVAPDIPPGVELHVVEGGSSRRQSVRRALDATPPQVDVVLIHDAARCLAPAALFVAVADAIDAGRDAVVPGLPVVDTLKQVDETGAVVATPDRSLLQAVQTPQGFRRHVLERAHRAAEERGDTTATDDAGLVEWLGQPVHVIPGHDHAMKITRPIDLVLAEALIAGENSSEEVRTTSAEPQISSTASTTDARRSEA